MGARLIPNARHVGGRSSTAQVLCVIRQRLCDASVPPIHATVRLTRLLLFLRRPKKNHLTGG